MKHQMSDRTFGLSFAAVFLVLFAAGWALFDSRRWWLMGLAALFALIAVAKPIALLPLNRLWNHAAAAIGHVNNRALLAIVFFGLITPLGALMRLLRKDFVEAQFSPGQESYLTSVRRGTDAGTFRDQF